MTDKPKRPRDASQLAKFIVDVATGEVEDKEPEKAEAEIIGSAELHPAIGTNAVARRGNNWKAADLIRMRTGPAG